LTTPTTIEPLRDALISQDFDDQARNDIRGGTIPESFVPDPHQTAHDECFVLVVDPYGPIEVVCG
jgi:hypothetical protein